MRPRLNPVRTFAARAAARPSYGFSGAGFLGSYHAGVAACLNRQGHLPHPDDEGYDPANLPWLTGVSAGSMIAAATRAGVRPEPDGMEVVLAAARKTRALAAPREEKRDDMHSRESKSATSDSDRSSVLDYLGVSLDVFTPGFSLIDQVEGPFREAMAKSLGGYCTTDEHNNTTIHDIDPDLFAKWFPAESLRIGLAEWRHLWPPQSPSNAYRYVDSYRNLDDVIACSMLSSYIPGVTGALDLQDKVPKYLGQIMASGAAGASASVRAGARLKEMTKLGMVRHGKTGLPIGRDDATATENADAEDGEGNAIEPSRYWDGGISDMFPTFDADTVVVSPLNGVYSRNPTICPPMPSDESDATIANEENGGEPNVQRKQHQSTSLTQNFLFRYLPSTFRHCRKSELGLNTANADAAVRMIFSSSDEELCERFREGYDDARRFLDERGQLRVITG